MSATNVPKFLDVPYVPFDPTDPLTTKLVTTLRNMFPEGDQETFEFLAYFLASTRTEN
jgi:hypothetical protein